MLLSFSCYIWLALIVIFKLFFFYLFLLLFSCDNCHVLFVIYIIFDLSLLSFLYDIWPAFIVIFMLFFYLFFLSFLCYISHALIAIFKLYFTCCYCNFYAYLTSFCHHDVIFFLLVLFTPLQQDELVGKSIYNIIHVGDHTQFSNILLPMTLSKLSFLNACFFPHMCPWKRCLYSTR